MARTATADKLLLAQAPGKGVVDRVFVQDIVDEALAQAGLPKAGADAAFTGNLTVGGDLAVTGNLLVGGTIILSAVPTADPHVAGQVWSNSGALTISAGA